jgi:hypothetical protein
MSSFGISTKNDTTMSILTNPPVIAENPPTFRSQSQRERAELMSTSDGVPSVTVTSGLRAWLGGHKAKGNNVHPSPIKAMQLLRAYRLACEHRQHVEAVMGDHNLKADNDHSFLLEGITFTD